MGRITPLKLTLIERGITQRRLAEETGMNPGIISWIANGRLNPDDSQKARIATALQTDEQELFSK